MTDTFHARLYEPTQAHRVLADAWAHVKAWVMAGHRLTIEIKPETRSTAQNRLMHALIGDIARQAEWLGKRRTPDEWKVLLVSGHAVATKQGAEMVPGLEGEFVNIRESTARMSRARASSLCEYIIAWSAAHDVELQDAQQWMIDLDTGEVIG